MGKGEDVDLKAPVMVCEIYGEQTTTVLDAIARVAVSAVCWAKLMCEDSLNQAGTSITCHANLYGPLLVLVQRCGHGTWRPWFHDVPGHDQVKWCMHGTALVTLPVGRPS